MATIIYLVSRWRSSFSECLSHSNFQVALLSSGRDPLLMRELCEASQAMEKHQEEDRNNNKCSSVNGGNVLNTSISASRSLSHIPPLSASLNNKRSFAPWAGDDVSQDGPKPKKPKKGVSFAL